MKQLLVLVPIFAGLLVATLAYAQLAINVPVTAPAYPAGTPEVMIDPPGSVMASPSPSMGSSPGGAAGTTEGSTVSMFSNGLRQRVKTYSDYATVRTFDPDKGILSLQDGTAVRFPSNFAFVDTPQVGQPVTIYYIEDREGNHVLSAIDMGTQGASTGS